MIRVSFDPFEICPNHQLGSLFYLRKNVLNYVFILHRFARGRLPAVSTPIDEPFRHTIDSVFAIGYDHDVSIPRYDFERSKDAGEFGSLVGLP